MTREARRNQDLRGAITTLSLLPPDDFYPLIELRHSDPHRLLGIHVIDETRAIVRVWYPGALSVTLKPLSKGVTEFPSLSLEEVDSGGLFESLVERGFVETIEGKAISYELEVITASQKIILRDPYAFTPQMGDLDLYLFSEGRHPEAYRHLGAHPRVIEGVAGTLFALWAPNAQRVSVVGDFNHWDGRFHMMRRLGPSGVWEIFLPGVKEGDHYKYELRGPQGDLFLKTDPYGFFAQHDLRTACIVYDLGRYQWSDHQWMSARSSKNLYREPMSIYEVHLGSWCRVPEEHDRPLSYRELADKLVTYVLEMGFTHVELMPVMEHPFDGSWGYQVVNFFAPSSRFGKPDDFRYLVDRLHQAGIGVLLDWVPGHFPRDAHGLWRYDGTALYEHEDPRMGEHHDWGTLIFNYGRKEVRNFLIANALYWLAEYHIDGLRMDAVASMLYLDYSRKEGEWIPNEYGGRENLDAVSFIKECNELCYSRHPGIMMIAEESTAWPNVSKPTYEGGLGFGFKWNMGWMNDSLSYISRSPIHRKYHQGTITFSMLYAYHEHFILALSHDEVTHGKGSLLSKMPEDDWQKFANLRLFYAWMWGHPGKKLLFQGGEFAQRDEWSHQRSLDWHLLEHESHRGVQRLVQRLNEIYRTEPALFLLDDSHVGFEWIDFHDAQNSIWSFLRRAPSPVVASHGEKNSDLLVIVNATPVVRYQYRIGVPASGSYEVVLNSDDRCFWGSGLNSSHFFTSEPIGAHRFGNSLVLDLPSLSTLYLRVPQKSI
ncbi:MAG: 1,4-alpha-glucan branching protein GlgB [Verrucomicrobiae bacterium]|jgi:1,4-alpha-glucan branching enzyme|nr:1,4-alpha-glucan branching protein GlgB [Verrucomicrobiae bacterium]